VLRQTSTQQIFSSAPAGEARPSLGCRGTLASRIRAVRFLENSTRNVFRPCARPKDPLSEARGPNPRHGAPLHPRSEDPAIPREGPVYQLVAMRCLPRQDGVMRDFSSTPQRVLLNRPQACVDFLREALRRNLFLRCSLAPTEGPRQHNCEAGFQARQPARARGADEVLRSRASGCVG
jgi:hypothetical protein